MSLVNLQETIIDKQQTVQRIIEESRVGVDYHILLTIASLTTTLGLIADSSSVVIGSMLIAPLLSPVLAMGLSLVTTNRSSLVRSSTAILKSVSIVLALSAITAFLLGVNDPQNSEISQRIKPTLVFMYIAILSGMAATYAWAKPKLSARLPGIALTVSLLPPLCTVGIGISIFSREIIVGSLQLFLINLVGISLSSAVVFSLLGFH